MTKSKDKKRKNFDLEGAKGTPGLSTKEATPGGEKNAANHSSTAKHVPARHEGPRRRNGDAHLTSDYDAKPLLPNEHKVDKRIKEMIRRRANVEKRFVHLAKRRAPLEDTKCSEAVDKLKALENAEQKLLFTLRKEQGRYSQHLDGDALQLSSAQFYCQRLVDFEAHLRKHWDPVIELVQQTAPTGSSTSGTDSKKRARSASLGTNPEKRQKSSCHDVPGDAESAMGQATAPAISPLGASVAETSRQDKNGKSLTPLQSQADPLAGEEQLKPGEHDLFRDLKIQLGFRSLSVSGDVSIPHEQVAKIESHDQIFPHCPRYSRKAELLIRKRKEVDLRLSNVDKQLRGGKSESVDESLWERREEILRQRRHRKRKEKQFFKRITEEHEGAKPCLGDGSNPYLIRKEAQLRRLVESLTACLQHIREIHRKRELRDKKHSKKRAKRDNASRPSTLDAEPSGNPDPTFYASLENNDENQASLERNDEKHASPPGAHNETVELEERRRRMARIVAPFLQDAAIVYDVVTPRGRASDLRLMSGGRSSRRAFEVDDVSSGRLQSSSPESVAQDSPTEQTLKARRQSISKRTTPCVLPDGSPSSVERGEPTRITGPPPPKMGDIIFGSPGKLFDCRDQKPSAVNKDPFTDANSKSKRQRSGSRTSSSYWPGKNATPIPQPLPPYSLSTSAGQGQIKRESSTTPQYLESLPAKFVRAGTEPPREAKSHSTAQTTYAKQQKSTDSRSLLHSLPGSAEGNRIALEKEKSHWKNMLDL